MELLERDKNLHLLFRNRLELIRQHIIIEKNLDCVLVIFCNIF